jgi:hypothetical protein
MVTRLIALARRSGRSDGVSTMLSALEAVADRLDRLENPVASPTTPSRG